MTYRVTSGKGTLMVASGIGSIKIAEQVLLEAVKNGRTDVEIEKIPSEKVGANSNAKQKKVVKKLVESTKKYELTGETKEINGVVLHRIKALKDFVCQGFQVSKGDLGGWIESEKNLSQENNCWVFENAWVYGYAQVFGYARVFEDAGVYGYAEVYGNAQVSGNAQVFGYARVFEDAGVYGYARVFEDAGVYGYARVFEDAGVYGYALVYGDALVCGKAEVHGNAGVFEGKVTK